MPALKEILHALGVKNAERVCVFSDLTRFGMTPDMKKEFQKKGPEGICQIYIEALQETVTAEGGLFLPTFTYSACTGESFDPDTTPSQVGLLSEVFRSLPQVKRSAHPIFSVAGWGSEALPLLKMKTLDCFGDDSFFGLMRKHHGKYILLGSTFTNSATFIYHSLQRKCVPYRQFKKFSGKVCEEGNTFDVEVPYFVRKLEMNYKDSWNELESEAISKGICREGNYLGGRVLVMEAQQLDEYISQKLDENIYSLIRWT
jgi:aminoglycoside 3-N-acetyltransferase